MKKKKKKKVVNKDTKTYKRKEIRKLKNKLFKLWAWKVKENAGFKCELCGFPGDKKLKLNSHHIEHYNTNIFLRYDPRNGLCADAGCHKFRKKSAHRSFLTLYKYLTENRKDDLDYLLKWYDYDSDKASPWLEKPLNKMDIEELSLFKNYLEEKIEEYEK
jgi:hypothetical protein